MPRRIPHALGSLLCLGLLLAGTSPTAAQPQAAQRHFEAGNAHYAEGRYEHAIDAYRSALETGYASGALYYNLGNAYDRTGRLGRAILYYEKALLLLPDHPPLQHSLDVARRRAGAPPSVAPPGWQALAARVDPLPPFAAGLALYLLGAGVLGYRRWTGRGGRGRPLAYAALAAGLLLILGAWGASYARTLDRRAVVVAREAPLHTSPTRQAARDTTLQEGAVLELRRRQPSWTEVRLSNGRTGWLPAETVEEV